MRINDLVSVVLPIYNAEQFLAEAVDSVLAQTYASWELLLVDDGSADGSPAIARSYAERGPQRIEYLEHPGHRHIGVCSTRNLGIRQSRGEYIAFLDADDKWLPRKLSEQVDLMKTQPEAGLLYGHSIWFLDGDETDSRTVPPLAPPGKLYRPPDLLKLCYPLGAAGAPCPSSLMIRHSVMEKIWGYFDESFDEGQIYEDQAFLAKFYLNTPVFVSDASWDMHRIHPSSAWQRGLKDGTDYRMRAVYLQWLQAYLKAQRIDDPQIRKALHKLRWPYRHPWLARVARFVRRIGKHLLGRTP